MYKVERFLYIFFQIDTNRINSRSRLENMNQLEKWHSDGVIHIEMSAIAQQEATEGQDSMRMKKTYGYDYSETLANTPEERALLSKIETILFPGGAKNQNQKNDIEIVFNAHKYQCILITADGASKSQPGGILGHKDELEDLGIQVLSDEEAVKRVHNLILQRDQWTVEETQKSNAQLPDWVGKD